MWHQSTCLFEEMTPFQKAVSNGSTVIASQQLISPQREQGGLTNSISHSDLFTGGWGLVSLYLDTLFMTHFLLVIYHISWRTNLLYQFWKKKAFLMSDLNNFNKILNFVEHHNNVFKAKQLKKKLKTITTEVLTANENSVSWMINETKTKKQSLLYSDNTCCNDCLHVPLQ